MRALLTIAATLLFFTTQAQTYTLTQDTSVKLEAKTYFDTVDVQPAFKGSLGDYINKNLKVAPGTKFPPKITVQFWVDTFGKLSHVQVLDKTPRAPATPLEKEVVRVVKAMPAWTPGYYKGRKVTVRYALPLMF